MRTRFGHITRGSLYRLVLCAGLCCALFAPGRVAFATVAGTVIKNSATVYYFMIPGVVQSAQTNTTEVIVVEAPNVVVLTKTATVINQFNGTEPIPGATIRYTITATVTGSGTATGVVITDLIPLNTTYIPNSLKLGGAALSDGADADAGDVGGTPVTVTVSLGNLTSLDAKLITFKVKIN